MTEHHRRSLALAEVRGLSFAPRSSGEDLLGCDVDDESPVDDVGEPPFEDSECFESAVAVRFAASEECPRFGMATGLGEVVDGVAQQVGGDHLVDFCGLESARQLPGSVRGSRPLDARGGADRRWREGGV